MLRVTNVAGKIQDAAFECSGTEAAAIYTENSRSVSQYLYCVVEGNIVNGGRQDVFDLSSCTVPDHYSKVTNLAISFMYAMAFLVLFALLKETWLSRSG